MKAHEYLGYLNTIKISDHFNLSDFECRGKLCCGFVVKVHPRILEVAEQVYLEVDREIPGNFPLHLISAYRCPKHNKAVGGKHSSFDPLDPDNSFHVQGRAIDIKCPGIPMERLARICRDVSRQSDVPFRVGFYESGGHECLHLDTPPDDRLKELPRIFGDLWPEE